MAAAAIGVAHRHGLIVPDDLTIVGFDDSPSAISVWPELTTIDQPVSAMASSAFNLVLGKAEPNSKSDGALPFDYIHPWRLIKRGSSGPANVAN
jgi:LacI family transcriptional regulator